jgi:rRNA maturation RNase YbeY
MSRINFFNEDVKFKLSDRIKTKSWIKFTIEHENLIFGSINIVFCSDRFLHGLNVGHLGHDTYTDIITFPLGIVDKVLSGDIYISIERVLENAIKFKQPPQEELRRVVIHGILHLCGFKDKTKQQKEGMRNKEDYYLEKFDSFFK